MGLMEELIEVIVKHADYRYNLRKERLRKDFEAKGFKVYFAHELTSCRRKSELRKAYPKLELELMQRPPLLLGEIVQRGVKAYLPEDVEEERTFHKVLGDTVIIGTPDFYSQSRKSVYELKFMRGKPEPLKHHRLRACIYRWLSDAEHAYLLYCSPKGFREFEVNDEFNDNKLNYLMNEWSSPMWDWECKLCAYNSVCLNKASKK
jgi:CRISPR/Cas system-associated exonuclease Cas4 (RecB family)